MIHNLSNLLMPQEVQAAAVTKLEELLHLLGPWLFTLSAEEREGMNHMGDRSEQFVRKGAGHAKAHPKLLPGIVPMEDYQVDAGNIDAYRPLVQLARQLYSGLADGYSLSGSEALGYTLLFYGSVKTAADKGVAGAEAIYEDMATRFPQRRKRRPADTPAGS